jgi:hypothetical protein
MEQFRDAIDNTNNIYFKENGVWHSAERESQIGSPVYSKRFSAKIPRLLKTKV